MHEDDLQQRLSKLSTAWDEIMRAHAGLADGAALAQQRLLRRYGRAIFRYLLASVRDEDAAEELSQEFALRFVRGDFKHLDPARGRFRDYVKAVLGNLVKAYRQKQNAQAVPLPGSNWDLAAPDPAPEEADPEFVDGWKEELLTRAWEELADHEQQTGQPYYTVLRFRSENPAVSSAQMAEQLGAQLGKAYTDAAVRQVLHRAREKYADLLVEEVALSLQTTESDRLEQELTELGLLDYCRSALRRRKQQA